MALAEISHDNAPQRFEGVLQGEVVDGVPPSYVLVPAGEYAQLQQDVLTLKAAAGLDEEPIRRAARYTKLTTNLRTAGWLGGVLAFTEATKFLSWLVLKDYLDIPTVAYLQGNAPWIAGFFIGGEFGGKLGNALGIRASLWRMGQTPDNRPLTPTTIPNPSLASSNSSTNITTTT